jgi:hypothetical protein
MGNKLAKLFSSLAIGWKRAIIIGRFRVDEKVWLLKVTPSYEETKIKLETTWNKCFRTAERFYKTACFCLDNGWNEKAVFDLHQATQHSCMALLRVYTDEKYGVTVVAVTQPIDTSNPGGIFQQNHYKCRSQGCSCNQRTTEVNQEFVSCKIK